MAMRKPQYLFALVSHYMWGKPKADRDTEMKKAFALAKEKGYTVAIGRYAMYSKRRAKIILD